jgi:protein phosphatase 2C family protein 2/3
MLFLYPSKGLTKFFLSVSSGNLAMSRSLGDIRYKNKKDLPPEKQIMTADPEIICHELTPEDEFIVLACDGIWDCFSSSEVIKIIRHLISIDTPFCDIPGTIFDHCLRPDSDEGHSIGQDNMTMILVALLHGRTNEEWYEWVKGRVGRNSGYTIPELYSKTKRHAFEKKKAWHEQRERGMAERVEKERGDGAATQGSQTVRVHFCVFRGVRW